jgi:GDPmannose 4,6-dehydratase
VTKTAFITGISGQDGSYLAEFLLELGYRVTGIIRRNSVAENQDHRLLKLTGNIELTYGDLLDNSSLINALYKFKPDEIYNLAAQSHVRISSEIPQFTVQVNAMGALNLLEAYRLTCPNSHYYQASSSEMFGQNIDPDGFQRESTKMDPVSPYGCAKLFAYNLTRHYRNAYKLHAVNGILFNHESPRRGSNFVTNKVVIGAISILNGKQKTLEMGNLDSYRDWGHSYDYVRAMHLIINNPEPSDFVVSTGESHSVRELCDYVFSKLGLDYRKYVVQNTKFLRPEELRVLKGDSSKIRTQLKWEPKYTFEKLLDEMIEYWQNIYGA